MRNGKDHPIYDAGPQNLIMKFFTPLFIIFLLGFTALGQNAGDILARANGSNYTADSLASEELKKTFLERAQSIRQIRKNTLEEMLGDMLLKQEASFRKMAEDKILSIDIYSKIPDPPEAEIVAVYNANKEQLENKPLKEVRKPIIAFLRRDKEQKAYEAYIAKLKIKYKVSYGADVNSPGLKATDILASFGTNKILANRFEARAANEKFEFEEKLYQAIKKQLEQTIYSELILAEARKENTEPEMIIRREISDKMQDFSDEERSRLEGLLQDRLFRKYNYSLLLRKPDAPRQNIEIANGAIRGKADAPVTIVMFTDFQCSACKRYHPILQEAIRPYEEAIKFVVRNYPLTATHADAFNAAQAAQAAKAQGKFFEYTEILYANQDKLDIASLKKYASDLGLNRKQFDIELDSGKYAAILRKDMEDGEFYGVSSTPTIFINGVRVAFEDFSLEGFKNIIENALKAK